MGRVRLGDVVWTAVRRFGQSNISLLSGAIAYFTLLSIAPVLVIAVQVAGIVFGREAAQREIVATLSSTLGSEGAEAVASLSARAGVEASTPIATILGIAVTIYAASQVFVRLQQALNAVWDVQPRPPERLRGRALAVLRKRLLSFGAIFVVGLLVLGSMLIKAVVGGIESVTGEYLTAVPWMWRGIEMASTLVLLSAFLALVYRTLPDVVIRWKDALVGGAFTSVLMSLGTVLIGLYLSHFATRSVSGAAGSLIILLLWTYYTANVFFLGAQLTRSWAETHGFRRPVEPQARAVDAAPPGEEAQEAASAR